MLKSSKRKSKRWPERCIWRSARAARAGAPSRVWNSSGDMVRQPSRKRQSISPSPASKNSTSAFTPAAAAALAFVASTARLMYSPVFSPGIRITYRSLGVVIL